LAESSERDLRSLDQLELTVDYLLGCVFADQMPPPLSDAEMGSSSAANTANANAMDVGNVDPNEISIWDDTPVKTKPGQRSMQQKQQHTPFSLSDTVAFIDDRLRAVQKDLVTLLGNLSSETSLDTDSSSSSSNTRWGNPSSSDSGSSQSIANKQQRLKHLQRKHTVREMQAKMIRYNILASYLLGDVPSSKYQVKFGARALRTSLTCYLDLSATLEDDYQSFLSNESALNNDSGGGGGTTQQSSQYHTQYNKECQTHDEILAYAALLHSAAVIRSEEKALPPASSGGELSSSMMDDSGSGWGALLSAFCGNVAATSGTNGPSTITGGSLGITEKYPRWKWALELASAVQEGNYQCYFNLLSRGPVIDTATPSPPKGGDAARFLIIARCCASHSLNMVRLGQLRRYNHSFGKGEKVSARDLARLLRFSTTADDANGERISNGSSGGGGEGDKSAIDFCRDAGLPIGEKDDHTMYVVMKAGPIKIDGDDAIGRICNAGRLNDEFLFGSKLSFAEDGGEDAKNAVEVLADQLSSGCGIGEDSVDDWENREESNEEITANHSMVESEKNMNDGRARMDEDNVVIPAGHVMRNLIL